MSVFRFCLAVILISAPGGIFSEEKKPAPPKISSRQRMLANSVNKVILEAWNTDPGIGALVKLPTGKGNAAEYYARLEGLYQKERLTRTVKGKIQRSASVSITGKGVQEILAAAKIKECRFTPELYPNMEKGTNRQPDMIVFTSYANATINYAKKLEHDGKAREADEAFQSAMIMGWHFTNDRSNLITFMLGLNIKLKTARVYSRFLQHRMKMDKARLAEVFSEHTIQMLRLLSVKSRVYLGDFRKFNCLYSTIKIAKSDVEPLWRQEAVLRLGVMRLGAPGPDPRKKPFHDEVSQQAAQNALLHVAGNDPKPWIRKLALWAIENVTPEQFAEMRREAVLKSLQKKDTDDEK